MDESQWWRALRCIGEADDWVSGDIGVELYHYVRDSKAVENIAEHKQLRLGRFNKMWNDRSEVRFASEVFSECVDDLAEDGTICPEDAERLKESVAYTEETKMLVLHRDEMMVRPVKKRVIPYVACFTLNRDESMWKEFEADARLILSINEPHIRSSIRMRYGDDIVDLDSYVKFLKVQYDGDGTRGMIRKLISDAGNVGGIDEWCDIVHDILMRCRLAIKPAEYIYEQEYRLIYILPKDMDENDPALRYLCGIHSDENGDEGSEQGPDYVLFDISDMLWGVTTGNPELCKERLMELADKSDFYVNDREDEKKMRPAPSCTDVFTVIGECPWCGMELMAYRPGRIECDNCRHVLEVDSGGFISIPEDMDLDS